MFLRLASLFLVVQYLIASIGLQVTRHFCGDEPRATYLKGITHFSCCPSEDESPDSDSCCHNETKFLKIKSEKEASAVHFLFAAQAISAGAWLVLPSPLTSLTLTDNFKTREPDFPPPRSVPVFLMNCQLRLGFC